ncbi:MAG: GH3 auxin-responsive promoter family protein [Calothrix sp. CSU_2_0]|nr:GH3 auxin-responsive promoter family protein [Calothrix sp. CSU_2_0]
MRLFILLFNQLLKPTATRFLLALENPKLSQSKIQTQIFKNFLCSEYGKKVGIKSIEEWQQIPIIKYHDIEKLISHKTNKTSPLTPEKILFYEKTSGSRAAAKLIPYTKSLRHSFNQMFCVWANDLITNGCKFSTGKTYFCISPQLSNSSHETIQNDSEYLDEWLRIILSPFLVFLPKINRIRNAEEFKYELAKALITSEKLEIISIWSPTFLEVILDYIQINRIKLATDLKNRISNQRQQILLSETFFPQDLWKNLKLISCWDSVNAADKADYLRSKFPNVLVQGKGLLATEAPMTIPLIAANGYVPVLDEVFFEFADVSGNIHLLHELQIGENYEIIISQKGGLYRYQIGDKVHVTHFYKNTPCLKFIGRTEEISDLVGEKLNLEFVRDVLDLLPLENCSFKSLVPVKHPQAHYLLLLNNTDIDIQNIIEKLDRELQRSRHYQYARLLGQLQLPKVLASPKIPEIISHYKISSGKKWGDIKHEVLVNQPIDNELFKLLVESGKNNN